MPNYSKLTIEANRAVLNQKLAPIKDIEKKLKDTKLTESAKLQLQSQRANLVPELGPAVDKVLSACDIAENNNRVYCQYIVDGHEAAKAEMAKLEPLLKRLETAWDDKVAFVFTRTIGQIEVWANRLKTDDTEFRAVKMVEEYRGNGWKMAVTEALTYVPDRRGAFETREKNRLDGIALSTGVVGQRTRVGEYVVRAQAMQKTAEMLSDKDQGEPKDFAKIREEAIDFADSVEKQVAQLTGEITSTIAQMERLVKTAMGSKVLNKDSYKPALLFEPKIDAFVKDTKGKAKTMRIQLGELVKKVGVNGMKDRYFKPQHDRADKAITQG